MKTDLQIMKLSEIPQLDEEDRKSISEDFTDLLLMLMMLMLMVLMLMTTKSIHPHVPTQSHIRTRAVPMFLQKNS